MAKGGQKNIDNKYVHEVLENNIKDSCGYLRNKYQNCPDKAERQKIRITQKCFNCDGKNRFK